MDATHTSERLISAREVAARLGRSPSWFSRNREVLERDGFPRPIRTIRRWCPRAIDRWINAQHRDSVDADEDPFVAAMRSGA